MEKLYNKKKAYGAYTDKKKADIAAMVRDEVQKDIEKIVDTDYKLQMLYMTKKPRRFEVFDEDTLKDLAAFQDSSVRGGTSAGISSSRSRVLSAKTASVSVTDESTGANAAVDIIETDEALKEMLSVLIQEANFLVEDNLSLLVEEDCTEDERNLFKLDSILTAISLQGKNKIKEKT